MSLRVSRMTPPLAKALVRPQNILLLLSLPLGWILATNGGQSPWVMIPGALFIYLLGVFFDIGEPAHRLAALGMLPEAELPEDLTGEYRGEAAPAIRVRDKVREYLDTVDPATRQMLAPLVPQLDTLAAGIGRLATKAQQIDRYLGTESAKELEQEFAQAQARLKSASDLQIRAHMEESCTAIQERLSAYNDLQLALERIRSQITSAVDGMTAMQARIVRISVADAARAREEREPVTDKINALLAAIEETDRHVAQITSIKQ